MPTGEDGRTSDLPDLATVTLDALKGLPDNAITDSLRRIIEELDTAGEPVAGFQSSI